MLSQNEEGLFVMPTFYAESINLCSFQPLLQFGGVEDESGRPVQQASLLVKTESLYAL